MPLTTDDKVLTLAHSLVQQLDALFGEHPGFRPAHAKGIMASGTFTPSSGALTLSQAPHLERATTPVTVRFSNSTGIPVIPDNDPNAAPHGCAVRFHLAEHSHTDIVAHSTDGFPTRTGEAFLEFLRAVAQSGDPKAAHPTPIETFLASHPAALAFVQAPKPAPSSLARDTYFGVSAMRFTNASGVSRYGRYRIVPLMDNEYLDTATAAAQGPDYLFQELATRLGQGPVQFRVLVQVANDDDVVNDATVHWPADRPLVKLGTIELTALVADNAAQQRQIIFDPLPRVAGIEPSDDPLLELRAAVYLISGRRRRAASG